MLPVEYFVAEFAETTTHSRSSSHVFRGCDAYCTTHPARRFSLTTSNSKAHVKDTHKAYADECKLRGMRAPRTTPPPASLPKFTAAAFTSVEREWLGLSVRFDGKAAQYVDAEGYSSPYVPNDHKRDDAGHVVGLSGSVRGALSIYVPAERKFYAVKPEKLQRVGNNTVAEALILAEWAA